MFDIETGTCKRGWVEDEGCGTQFANKAFIWFLRLQCLISQCFNMDYVDWKKLIDLLKKKFKIFNFIKHWESTEKRWLNSVPPCHDRPGGRSTQRPSAWLPQAWRGGWWGRWTWPTGSAPPCGRTGSAAQPCCSWSPADTWCTPAALGPTSSRWKHLGLVKWFPSKHFCFFFLVMLFPFQQGRV